MNGLDVNHNDLMTSAAGGCLTPEFVQKLHAEPSEQVPVLHLWHRREDVLEKARDALLEQLRLRGLRAQRCEPESVLPLVQTLNTWMADSLRAAPLPDAQASPVWVLEHAQNLPGPHMALIERIHTHFPELPLRLVLLSQTPLAPAGPAGIAVSEVVWREPAQAAPAPQPMAAPVQTMPASHEGWAWAIGAAVLIAGVAASLWWAASGTRPKRTPVAHVAPEVVSVPKVALPVEVASAPASANVPTPVASAPVAPTLTMPEAQVATVPDRGTHPAQAPTWAQGPFKTWVNGLPEGSHWVLHGQFASAREAEAFKAAAPVLANARIVQAVWEAGQKPRHGVLTGPFRSPERVSNYVQRLPWREQARGLTREELLKLVP